MGDQDPWGVLTEGVVQSFPTRGAALVFQREHAAFWGRRSPLMMFDGDRWVPAPPEPGQVPAGEKPR